MADLQRRIDTAPPELTRLESCDEIVHHDSPRHAIGDNLMMWCTRPDLCGLVLWGRMSAAEMRLLERVFDSRERNATTPCDFVLDARRLHGFDAELYERLTHSAARRLPDIQRRVRRHALLRSSGLIGGAVSGFYVTLDVELEWRVFTELAPALAWLDKPQPDVLAARLDRLVAEAVSGSSLLDRVRAILATTQGKPLPLGDMSRSLGMSRRSLQRALGELGTSFRDELYRARLEVGQRLLLENDDKIAAISRRLGFSTEANFIAFFRRVVGESPAAWRRRKRDHALGSFHGSASPIVV